MIDAILMALGFEGPGALLAVIGAAIAAVFSIWFTGRRSGRADAEHDAARDYRETRQEIDHADLGHGATDRERIDRLREIADRRGAGKD